MNSTQAQVLIEEFVSDTELQTIVTDTLNYCAALSAAVAETHGFHDDERAVARHLYTGCHMNEACEEDEQVTEHYQSWLSTQLLQAEIARIGEELGEAIDNIRHGSPPDDKCPEFPGWHVELGADVLIRVFDTLDKRGVNPGEIFVAKTLINNGRAYKHGKNS